MTRTKKLDSILHGLLYIDKRRLNNESVNKAVTIEWLSDFWNLDCEIWELKSLKIELLDKELITEIDGELHITEKGKHFSTREQGFGHLDKIADQEHIIRERLLKNFNTTKLPFGFRLRP